MGPEGTTMSLELRNVTKTYREPGGGRLPVLNIANFTLAAGEQVVLVGSSGGGKTTLLNIIAGITTPDERNDWAMSFRPSTCYPRLRHWKTSCSE
jgi:ABC-type lipoprotein export system ATPase subunit